MPKKPRGISAPIASPKTDGMANQFDATLRRLMLATGAKTETEFAKILGIQQPNVTAARRRGQIPPSWIITIAQRYCCSADWIISGEGSLEQGALCAASSPIASQALDQELVMIPRVKARLSAGNGSLETSGEVVGRYAFRGDYIRTKGNPKAMVLMDVSGDSMAPEIKDGDMVLIDQNQTDVIAGSIFAIGIDDDVVVKYVERIPGKLVLRSKNPEFSPIEVDLRGDLGDSVRIIGRVLWWCREAK